MKINLNILTGFTKKLFLAGMLLLAALNSCKKAIDVGPPVTSIVSSNAYVSNGNAESVLAGIFDQTVTTAGLINGSNSLSINMGLSADEYISFSTSVTYAQYFTNNLLSTNLYYWQTLYNQIFNCNVAVTGITASGSITAAIKNQLLGEAKMIRALNYFYAVNLYGDVPLALTTDYLTNNVITRSPKVRVYQQIVQDLKDAAALLPDGSYLNGTGVSTIDKYRPNKQAALALLARVYLYTGDWANAEQSATAVISNAGYVLEPVLTQVFLKASRETIWSLQPIQTGFNNGDAQFFIPTTNPAVTGSTFPLSKSLLSAFEPGDKRLTSWVGTYTAAATPAAPVTIYNYAFKYKVNVASGVALTVTEPPVVLRLAEQYLIRAEARAQQNNIGGAQSDLNAIRSRAGLPGTTATTQAALFTAILQERRVELFSELGHRWFDLIRTGQIDPVMTVASPVKGGIWASYKDLLPVRILEIQTNPNLTQNPGY